MPKRERMLEEKDHHRVACGREPSMSSHAFMQADVIVGHYLTSDYQPGLMFPVMTVILSIPAPLIARSLPPRNEINGAPNHPRRWRGKLHPDLAHRSSLIIIGPKSLYGRCRNLSVCKLSLLFSRGIKLSPNIVDTSKLY